MEGGVQTRPADGDNRLLASTITELTTRVDALSRTIEALKAQLPPPSDIRYVPFPDSRSEPQSTPLSGSVVFVRMLGPFKINVGGEVIGPALQAQVRTALQYILSQSPHMTSRDVLADLLWPDVSPRVAFSRLRVVLHGLRRSLSNTRPGMAQIIVSSGNHLLLNPTIQIWIDVTEFELYWKAGWQAAKAGRKEEALVHYETAEALYAGNYLEDEPYADWTLLKRETLKDAYANILTMLASISFETRDFTGAILWSHKLLAEDNCREDAYRILIKSHQFL